MKASAIVKTQVPSNPPKGFEKLNLSAVVGIEKAEIVAKSELKDLRQIQAEWSRQFQVFEGNNYLNVSRRVKAQFQDAVQHNIEAARMAKLRAKADELRDARPRKRAARESMKLLVATAAPIYERIYGRLADTLRAVIEREVDREAQYAKSIGFETPESHLIQCLKTRLALVERDLGEAATVKMDYGRNPRSVLAGIVEI